MDAIMLLGQVRADYKDQLRKIHDTAVEKARVLGKKSEKGNYTDLKEEIHDAFSLLGNRLLEAGFHDFSLRVFSVLERTIHECREITGAEDFSSGLALYSQGVVHISQKNLIRGISLIQLAWEEDKCLSHHGAAEKVLQEWAASACDYIRALLSYEQDFVALDPNTILDRLGNDQFRLLAIVSEYQTRLYDWRSLAVKDAAETNIMRICKLTEYYLKTKLGKTDTLAQLVETAFRKDRKSPAWWREWKRWKDTKGATEYRTRNDDAKIENILDSSDHTTAKSFELLCLLRNFTAHIYNERSILFDRYEECFKACLGALMYTLYHVG